MTDPMSRATYAVVLCLGCILSSNQWTVRHDITTTISDQCRLAEIQRTRLRLESGHRAYVEPIALAAANDKVLLSGTPNYVWQLSSADTLAVPRGFFGVVVARDGTARTVHPPRPIAGFAGVRTRAREDGSWWVAFAELDGPETIPEPGRVLALWVGVLDGMSWRSLEKLPLDPGLDIQSIAASSLAEHEGRLAWAVPVRLPSNTSQVALFERVGGKWTYSLVPTSRITYVDAAYSGAGDLYLAIVRPDTTVASYSNSLFLYSRKPPWSTQRLLARGGDAPVYHPSVVTSPGRDVVTWFARVGTRLVVHALYGSLPVLNESAVVVDYDASDYAFMLLNGRRPLWVVHHLDGTRSGVLRFVVDSAGSPLVLGEFAYPFDGPFAATEAGPNELLVSGPLRGQANSDSPVVTLLLRVHIECGERAP